MLLKIHLWFCCENVSLILSQIFSNFAKDFFQMLPLRFISDFVKMFL